MKPGNIAKLFAFCLSSLIIILALGNVFNSKSFASTPDIPDRIYAFNRQPEDSIDAVFIGASVVHSAYSQVDAYHDFGYTSQTWATAGQPFYLTTNIIREIQKKQSPQVYVISYSNICGFSGPSTAESAIRNVTDNMSPFSANRYDAILNMMPRESSDIAFIYYFSSYLRFHDRWDEALRGEMRREDHGRMGTTVTSSLFRESPFGGPVDFPSDTNKPDSESGLKSDVKAYLYQLLTWVKDENLPVLFMYFPCDVSRIDAAKKAEAESLFDQYDVPYIDLNDKVEEIGLDGTKDMVDTHHASHEGREKITDYIAVYLGENYDLPDHRRDPAYAAWDIAYDTYQADIETTYAAWLQSETGKTQAG